MSDDAFLVSQGILELMQDLEDDQKDTFFLALGWAAAFYEVNGCPATVMDLKVRRPGLARCLGVIKEGEGHEVSLIGVV